MLRQSSSRSHRSKKLRASHSFQAILFVAVAIWIVYQLTHSFGERRPVAVETGISNEAGPARRRLGRQGFVHFAGRESVDGSWSDGSSDDPSRSKAGDDEGDEEDREGDDDDAAADADVDDADDGLAVAVAADEEDDGVDFQSQDGSREDDPMAVHSGTQNGLNTSVAAAAVNGTGTVQDGAAVLLRNATGDAADVNRTVLILNNNISSVDVASLRDRGTPVGDVANSFAVGAPVAEEKPTSTGDSGHGIST